MTRASASWKLFTFSNVAERPTSYFEFWPTKHQPLAPPKRLDPGQLLPQVVEALAQIVPCSRPGVRRSVAAKGDR